MEEEKKSKKRLSPDATVLLTIASSALAVILYRLIYYIVTGA